PGFDHLITAFKRVNNILGQAEEKNIEVPKRYDARRFRQIEEKQLNKKYRSVQSEVRKKIKAHDYYGVLKILASLRKSVDNFFDEVLVMDPDEQIKKNRLAFLNNIVSLFSPLGKISELEIK
ncbi:MAG: DALR anticodon-binding domain-containing protein, partial [Elusimicrobiota bacterium]